MNLHFSIDDMPVHPHSHFMLHLYNLIACIVANLETLENQDPPLDEMYPFLSQYQTLITDSGDSSAWESYIEAWEASTDIRLPLRTLMQSQGLTQKELQILLLAGLVEEDIRFGALFATLQDPLKSRRPCIGLIEWLLSKPTDEMSDVWFSVLELVERGLLMVENQSGPRSEWVCRVPAMIWDALRGYPRTKPAAGITWQSASEFPPLDALILPDELLTQVKRIPKLVSPDKTRTVVLRGMRGTGRRTILGAIACELDADILLCDWQQVDDDVKLAIGSYATLIGAIPVLRCSVNPGETLTLPGFPGYQGLFGVTLGPSGGLNGELMQNALGLTIPPPDIIARQQHWEGTEVPIDPEYRESIARQFLLTGGYIHQGAYLAQSYATLNGYSEIAIQDVQQALRSLHRQVLDTLATPLKPAGDWDSLIVSDLTQSELMALEARCRTREQLQAQVGQAFRRNLNRGVRAMFSGPSGTGKTLAARVLATELQMDLYRVDLASVVNKYIGETERNLNEVFSRAEELDVMLLLDEGDSLMAKRTNIQNANDRYANLETNYLLQRLENYEGIVVITTNAYHLIDSAFIRRLDVTVEFAAPDARERWQLWQLHLPEEHDISSIMLEEIAQRCSITGGQIRNAALHAALLALSENSQIQDDHLEQAVQREFRKAGASYPLTRQTNIETQLDRLDQFSTWLNREHK